RLALLDADGFLALVREKQSLLDQNVRDSFAERFTSHLLRSRLEPVNVLQGFYNRERSRQVPRDRVIDRLLDRVASRRVEWIAARDHHGAADQVKGNEQPP